MPSPFRPLIDRLRRGSVVTAAGCWEWVGRKNGWGYGEMKIGGRHGLQKRAHRVAWETYIGPIPSGLFVLHRCDNRGCINPGHLFLGTHADNMRDRDLKGRTRAGVGERQGQAKLTAGKVRMIRRYLAGGGSQIEVAAFLGVTQSTVSAVARGLTWRHVS